MLFDKLATLAERHTIELPGADGDDVRFRTLRSLMKKARLFKFLEDPETHLARSFDQRELMDLREQFFLPFEAVAIEDEAACIVVWDTEVEQRGFGTRHFVCIQNHSKESNEGFVPDLKIVNPIIEDAELSEMLRNIWAKYRDSKGALDFSKLTAEQKEQFHLDMDEYKKEERVRCKDEEVYLRGIERTERQLAEARAWLDMTVKWPYWINIGTLESVRILESGSVDPAYTVSDCGHYHKGKGMIRESAVVDQRRGGDPTDRIIKSIREMLYFNTPDRFVVEVEGLDSRKPAKDRIPRSGQRPYYLMLRPHEIRKAMGLSEPKPDGKMQRAPHERRRHYRTFRSDRYVNMKGRTIVIPAMWIGPATATVNNRRYCVLLDV